MDDLIRRYDVLGKAQWIGSPATWDDPWPEGKDAVTVEDIEAIPAVDAVEVVHGRWVESEPEESFVFAGHTYYPPKHCSVCGKTALDEPWTYCPNCGARMDGHREEENNALD